MTITRALTVIVSLALLGAVLSAVVRFGYLAHVIVDRGASLDSVSFLTLTIEVMELHITALYGAVGGAALGLTIVLIDIVRFGRREPLTWHEMEVGQPGADDLIKSTRAKAAEEYLERRRRESGAQEEDRSRFLRPALIRRRAFW